LSEEVMNFMSIQDMDMMSNIKKSREISNRVMRAKKSAAESRKPLSDEN